MPWIRKRTSSQKRDTFSMLKKFRKEKKISEEAELFLLETSLEDLICLKLEIAARAAGNFLYGVPIWYRIENIVKDAVLRYGYMATTSNHELARFIGVLPRSIIDLLRRYKTEHYFISEEYRNKNFYYKPDEE